MEQIMQPCLIPKLLPDWGLSGNVFYEFGTRLDNSIPKVWERERNKKIVPKSWEQEGHKKSNPNTWKPEVDDENPFPKFGNGMRDFHSQEWSGTGIPADPCIDNGVGVW